jgi:hypothetical protein
MFWNYTVGATNKILLHNLAEPAARKLGGIAALIGLGWMVTSMRTKHEQWDRMSPETKLARVLDQSNITGVLLPFIAMGEGMSIAAGLGDPVLGGRWKGQVNPGLADMVLQVLGPAAETTKSLLHGLATGDLQEISWGLPFRNMIGLKSFWDRAIQAAVKPVEPKHNAIPDAQNFEKRYPAPPGQRGSISFDPTGMSAKEQERYRKYLGIAEGETIRYAN